MSAKLGALIPFSARVEAVVSFYRSLGVPLERETHDEPGPVHYAAELAGVHVAIYEALGGDAISWREAGCTWPGFTVANFDATLGRVRLSGAKVLAEPEGRPWGMRAVVADPDGRPVEIWSEAAIE